MARFGVCMIITHFPPYRGGAEMQAERLSSWLASHDVQVMVITRQIENTPRYEMHNGYEIYRVPQSKFTPLRVLNWFLYGSYYMLKHRKKWDVAHTHDPSLPSTLGYLVTRLLRTKNMVINIHLGGANGDLAMMLRRGKWARMNLNAFRDDPRTYFVAIDKPILAELEREKVDPAKVFFRTNGIDPNAFPSPTEAEKREARRALGLPLDKQILVAVCRHVQQKGLDYLLDAMKQLPENVYLVLVGEGELREGLMARAEKELPGRVEFPGRQQNVLPYLHAADAWVLPSLNEALPVSLLEAMSTALPIIATPVGGVATVVEDNVNGYLVPPTDVSALANALKRLLSDPVRMKELGNEARQTILNRYAIDIVSSAYVELYQEIISKTNPNKPLEPKLETAK